MSIELSFNCVYSLTKSHKPHHQNINTHKLHFFVVMVCKIKVFIIYNFSFFENVLLKVNKAVVFEQTAFSVIKDMSETTTVADLSVFMIIKQPHIHGYKHR